MSKIRVLAGLVLLVVAPALFAETLEEVPARGRLALKRWKLAGTPRGLAVADDGTIYAGLAKPQAVVAIDAKNGTLSRRVILDREEIASTKDFAALRIARDLLYIAQGSDESVSILSLPELEVVREIGLEGEIVRDALPDPQGRFVYVLGRKVRVWDARGERERRVLGDIDPMALATDLKGKVLVVVGAEAFPSGHASVAVFYDTASFREIGRLPLQTDREIVAAFFAADDTALVVVARDWLGEAPAAPREEKETDGDKPGQMRMRFGTSDIVSGESICLPDVFGPQVATTSRNGRVVVFAEKRCPAGSTFVAARRRTKAASLYGVSAWGVARMPDGTFAATDPDGFLTIYRQPEPRE